MLIELTSEHIDEICEIENTCFTHPQSRNNIETSISNDKYFYIGFVLNNVLVGYGSVFIVTDEAYINNIAVIESCRGKNIGTQITENLISIAKSKKCSFITLEVRESNLPAIKLYEKNKFKKVAVRKKYYVEPIENAIIMTKNFGEEK